MEIRYIDQSDDLFEISNVYECSWKQAYKNIIPQSYLDSIPGGRWADSIKKAERENLVLLENGKIIGTAGFGSSRWEKYSGFGEIVSIYLLPEYMGRGYGTALLKKCISELESRGFEGILLWVLEENFRARRFYESRGFVCSGEYMCDSIGGRELREVMYLYRRDKKI